MAFTFENYKLWCMERGLRPCEFKNLFEFKKSVEEEKMMRHFFFNNGFFVSWKTKSGEESRVFSKSKKEIETLFADLKSKIENVEKYKVINGQLHRLA